MQVFKFDKPNTFLNFMRLLSVSALIELLLTRKKYTRNNIEMFSIKRSYDLPIKLTGEEGFVLAHKLFKTGETFTQSQLRGLRTEYKSDLVQLFRVFYKRYVNPQYNASANTKNSSESRIEVSKWTPRR
jgi:hypothetical protein